MKKLQKLRSRIAEAFREAAFRLDGQPLMRLDDVEAGLNACCAEHHEQEAMRNEQEAMRDAHQAYGAFCAQNQAGEMGFWVPKRGSGSPN
jgi:hypothetical protein